MEETIPPIDFEKAQREFDLDKEFLLNLINKFLIKIKSQAKEIRDAVKADNWKRIKEEAHSIKGGALNLTAYDISAVALELEEVEILTGGEQVITLVEKLEKEIEKLEIWYNSVKHP